MFKVNLIVPTPDDSNDDFLIEYEVNVSTLLNHSERSNRIHHTIAFARETTDPILGGFREYFRHNFFRKTSSGRAAEYYRTPMKTRSVKNHEGGVLLNLYGCPILVVHSNTVSINGIKHSLANGVSILARLFVKAIREKDGAKLMMHLAHLNKMPENISYVLENRAPFNFYHEYEKHEVRLNVQLIGDKEVAIEVSDGIWGTMSIKEMDSFCNAHRHGSKRSRWAYISPRKLFLETVGKEPLDSEVKVMKSFLLQNRTAELVENRAKQLVHDMVNKYPYRLAIVEEEGFVAEMFVRGKLHDWLLKSTYRGNRKIGGRQDVQTFVYSTDSEGNGLYRGPICIDNLGTNSSVGDQYVARALALLNDNVIVDMVSTIKSYLPPNEVRDDNYGLP